MVRSRSGGYALGSAVECGLGMSPAMVSAARVPEENDVFSLVSAARDGDRGALGRLYERYARMVHGILLARVPMGEVDDLVQDGFVKALRQVHTLREVACFGGWLSPVAPNRANDSRRRAVDRFAFAHVARARAPALWRAATPR